MKKQYCYIVPLVLLVLQACLATAQEQKFRAVLSAGIVGAQVDGDPYTGYDKIGPYGGVYVNRPLGRKQGHELEMGLTYLQKGVRKKANPDKYDYVSYLMRLNYVEVPLLYKYRVKKIKFEGGLSVAYLFSYKEETQGGYYNDEKLLKRDISFNVGAAYYITENLLFNFRFNYSLLPFRPYGAQLYYTHSLWAKAFNRGLYTNNIIFSLNYIIQPVKKDA